MKRRAAKPFNYMAVVGVIFLIVVLLALFNMLKTTDSGTVGIGEVGIGDRAAPFAVPLATGSLEGDANIDREEACAVEGADVLRICDYFGRPLVMSFWFTKGASSCIDQQDVFDEVAARFRQGAGFVSINVRDDRDRVRELIDEHGWKVPVGHDRDGAVSNIYRVGGCPTFLFFRKGGVLKEAEIGSATEQELTTQVRSLIDGQQEQPQEAPQAENGTAG